MGRYRDPQWLKAQSGTHIVSQYQLSRYQKLGEGDAKFLQSKAAAFKAIEVTFAEWTAVTTGYPNAVELGNITLYYAPVRHSLANEHAVCIGLQDANGNSATFPMQFVVNESPTNPGTAHPDWMRVWISADSAPAASLFVIVVG